MTICLPFAFLGIGTFELLLVLAVALMLFGPKELPKIARSLGKYMAQFRSLSDDFRSQVMRIEDEVCIPKGAEQAGEKFLGAEPETMAVENAPVVTGPVPADPAAQNKDIPHEPPG